MFGGNQQILVLSKSNRLFVTNYTAKLTISVI